MNLNYTAVIDNIINFLSKKSEPNSNTSENSILTLIALGAAVFILSLLAEYEKRKQLLLAFGPQEPQEHWDFYTSLKINKKMPNQTRLFFETIDKKYEENFKASKNQIVQFGISTGEFVSNLPQSSTRKIIGYDFSSKALQTLPKNIEQRQIDLNSINAGVLAYQHQVEKDLSIISDVFLIRTLEYLKPEAMELLMLAIITASQPGSRFYIEASFPKENITAMGTVFCYANKSNCIQSFFSERKDFHVEILDNVATVKSEENNNIERLVITKC